MLAGIETMKSEQCCTNVPRVEIIVKFVDSRGKDIVRQSRGSVAC